MTFKNFVHKQNRNLENHRSLATNTLKSLQKSLPPPPPSKKAGYNTLDIRNGVLIQIVGGKTEKNIQIDPQTTEIGDRNKRSVVFELACE